METWKLSRSVWYIFDEAEATYLKFSFATVFGYVTNGQYERAVGLLENLVKVGLHRRFL